MPLAIGPGMRVPAACLSRLNGSSVETVHLDVLLPGRRAAIVGVIGAFTPICTHDHIPEFVSQAGELARRGYELIICVAPNDPWTVKAWSDLMDPEGRVLFLSDGNLDLARRIGVAFDGGSLFLGETSQRYLLIAKNNTVERLSVEPSPTRLTCTRAQDIARGEAQAA